MNAVLIGYGAALAVLRTALFWIVVVLAVIAIVDWAVRTRRINPFSGVARLFRARVDPLMLPVERVVVRAGGRPSTAPWWTVAAVAAGGLVLIEVLGFAQGLLTEVAGGVANPGLLPALIVSWAFSLIEIALLVRVVSSWFNISPWSRWVHWSFVLTEWLLGPLRRIVPPLGMMDITPLIAYFILWLVRPGVVGIVARLGGGGGGI